MLTDPLPLPLPIPRSTINCALRLARSQPPETSVRAYRNAIAVLLASDYCTMMGFATDPEASDALSPPLALTLDVANVVLPGLGAIECRVVSAEATRCSVPPEACEARSAYVVICLDPEARQAALLGFVATVRDGTIALDRLQPIDELGTYLLRLEAANQTQPVQLWRWVEGMVADGWRSATNWLEKVELGRSTQAELEAGLLHSPVGHYRVARSQPLVSATKEVAIDGLDLRLNLELKPGETTDTIVLTACVTPRSPDRSLPLDLVLAATDLSDHGLRQQPELAMPDRLLLEFEAAIGDIFELRLERGAAIVVESMVL